MNALLKTLLLFALTLSLQARENPFSKYDYEEDKNQTTVESIQEDAYIKKMQKEIDEKTSKKEPVKVVTPKPAEKSYTKKELDAIIKKSNQESEKKTKALLEKELKNVKKEPEQIVYVKPRADIGSEDETTKQEVKTFDIERTVLPFLKISVLEDKFIIKTDYKILKKFNIEKENKIVFDFKAKVNFPTKRESFVDANYKSLVVGNHKEAGFFRVALELSSNVSNYNVDIKDDSITISKK